MRLLRARYLRSQIGLTAIELVVVLAVIATLAGLAAASFKLWESAKIETTCEQFDQIMSASIQWMGRNAQTDFTNIDSTKIQPYLQGLDLSKGAPWGGAYTVAASTPATTLSVSVTNIPADPGADIIKKLNARGWSASQSGTTITATKGA